MIKLLLSGCNGRMGRAVSELCRGSRDISVAAGIDVNAVKTDAYPVYADPLEFNGRADAVLDFSHVSTLESLLPYCLRRRLPLVLCTTGYSPEQEERIRKAAEDIPVFKSGNMSVGIALLSDLAERAARVLGQGFDAEIIETHHRKKLDAPSGTAVMLYDAVASGLPYSPEPVYDRHQVRRERADNQIGMHAVRGGTVVGRHDVLFAGHHETITLSHSAESREVFAAGALRAAAFVVEAGKPGLYCMKDMLGNL